MLESVPATNRYLAMMLRFLAQENNRGPDEGGY